jgi:NADH-quinone oxidoreductase subunit H
MIVGAGVFALLFLGGWNLLPWVPLASLLGWLHHATGSALWLHPLVAGIVSIAIFIAKILATLFVFMWVRWTLPRFRYDQVMRIGWQKLLPLSIANLIVYTVAIALMQR